MPYQEIWVKAETVLTHNGVTVYRTYTEDELNSPRKYTFTTNPDHSDGDEDDQANVRLLGVPAAAALRCSPPLISSVMDPEWVKVEKKRLWRKWREEIEPGLILQALREAIDAGLIQPGPPADTQPSRAAKAAAILHHTWGIEDRELAAQLYDRLAAGESMDDVLCLDPGRGVWECVENLSQEALWDNVVSLAHSIDACWEELR